MTESAVSSPRGAEISERSSELVLPSPGKVEKRGPLYGHGQELGMSEHRVTTEHVSSAADPLRKKESAVGPAAAGQTTPVAPQPKSHSGPDDNDPSPNSSSRSLGAALPGDRGPRSQPVQPRRPSFWRRIALGRRAGGKGAETPTTAPAQSQKNQSANAATQTSDASTPNREMAVRTSQTAAGAPKAADARELTNAIEVRIVEPMLQALVSVESKLERSHIELVGRADQVEQRLTQLWDIEEQLGALGEVQESLLQVSEQQRRLESAVVSQTQTIRWLVGAVFASLAVAAFVVAAVLR